MSLACRVKSVWAALNYMGLFGLVLLIPHCILRADLHHGWRGEAAQPTSDEAEGGVHLADGRPRPPLPQEDRREPAGQHGVRTAGPP